MTKIEKDDVLEAIGESARKTRKFQGLSQADVASAAGVNRTLVTLFEQGRVASFWLLYYYMAYLGLKIRPGDIYGEDK